jgi:integrase/recombinase XerD
MLFAPNRKRTELRLVDEVEAILCSACANTRRTYKARWESWSTYLDNKFTGSEDERTAKRFVAWLRSKPSQRAIKAAFKGIKLDEKVSESTVRAYVDTLKSIYDKLVRAKAVKENPFTNLAHEMKRTKNGDRRPTQCTDFRTIPRLFDLCSDCTKEGIRNAAMLAILYGAGRRASDVLALNVEDVRATQSGVHYLVLHHTKNGQPMEPVLPPWCAGYVTRLVEQRIKEGAHPLSRLFVSYYSDGQPHDGWSMKTLYRTFKDLLAEAGITNVGTHSGRATAITKLLSEKTPAGGPLYSYREIQEFSGHSSVAMVEKYDKRFFGKDNSPAHHLNYTTGNDENHTRKK